MSNDKLRTYSELITLKTFRERYRYLQLRGNVGKETFGYDRYLNQMLYRSPEWKRIRTKVIIRDNGYDLGLEDYPIGGRIIIHHMNPITERDIVLRSDILLDPEYLISVSHNTHEAIHFGDEKLIEYDPIERTPGDTKLW